jgi:hypothetical protein
VNREYAVDLRDGRVGQVMGREGGYVQLRPVGGGREWDCPPEAVGEAPVGEVLRAGYGGSTGRGGCRDGPTGEEAVFHPCAIRMIRTIRRVEMQKRR